MLTISMLRQDRHGVAVNTHCEAAATRLGWTPTTGIWPRLYLRCPTFWTRCWSGGSPSPERPALRPAGPRRNVEIVGGEVYRNDAHNSEIDDNRNQL
jgi:hypothetical protein